MLGDKYAATVKEATYDVIDKTIDPQIVRLKATGCDALIAAAIPDFAVQAIRKVYDLGWKPIFFMANISTSEPTVLEPAGLEKSVGLLSSAYGKDPSDPAWADDAGLKDWKAWMSKYLPGEDMRRPNFVNGYNYAATMVQVLKQAGNDLSRDNIMRQATNLHDLVLPMMLPGIKVNTSPRLLSGPTTSADAVGRQALGAVRRPPDGRKHRTALSLPAGRNSAATAKPCTGGESVSLNQGVSWAGISSLSGGSHDNL